MEGFNRINIKRTLLVVGLLFLLGLYALEPVDLNLVPESAYHQGKLFIKITEAASNTLKDELLVAKRGVVSTGISELDNLNSLYSVSSYTPVLHGLYEMSAASTARRHLHREYGFHLWFELTIDNSSDIIKAVKDFSRLESVETAEPVYRKSIIEPVSSIQVTPNEEHTRWRPNDPYYNHQWALRNYGQTIRGVPGRVGADMNIEDAWEMERGLSSVIVAVFDQGIAYNHPDIQANMWRLIGPNGNGTVGGYHGTHVAGTVSAVTNNGIGISGIAGGSGEGDGVRLMSCPIFGQNGSFANHKVYAADNGAAISQNSWAYSEFDVYNQVDINAINYFNTTGGGAVLAGGITIFGAGNDNSNRNQYPAYYRGTLAVASSNNRDRKSDFSNYGTWIDITAPGSDIISTIINNNYTFESGTSMACPHVSGVAALIVSYAFRNNIILRNDQLKEILLDTTDDIYQSNPTYIGQLGSGRVNAYAALLKAKEDYFGINNPQVFLAMPLSSSEIQLQWLPNENNDDIMIVTSINNQLGRPEDGTFYSIGNTIPGGGTVIYYGSEGSFNHTQLEADRTYYYKSFSYSAFLNYSEGMTTEATTHQDTHIDNDTVPPGENRLLSNYPNPFNPETNISFNLAEAETATLEIFDIRGKLLKTIIDKELPAGSHSYRWNGKTDNGSEVGGGIYIYRLITPSFNQSKKMILLK